MIFAYTRISTNKDTQIMDRQITAIEDYAIRNGFKIEKWSKERCSGSINTSNRPIYTEMKKTMRTGDVLILTDIDRLGRDADNIITELKDLKSLGIKTVILDTPYLNSWENIADDSIYQMIIDILITLKAHMAQQEREKIVTRINQGLDAAKGKGVILGRPKAEISEEFISKYKSFKAGAYGNLKTQDFIKTLGIKKSTYYKYIQILEKDQES